MVSRSHRFVLAWSTVPVGRALAGLIHSARELPAALRGHADDTMDLPWGDESSDNRHQDPSKADKGRLTQ